MERVLWVVGSLMYVMACTRPDIAYTVGTVSHCLSNQEESIVMWLNGSWGIFKVLLVWDLVLEIDNYC